MLLFIGNVLIKTESIIALQMIFFFFNSVRQNLKKTILFIQYFTLIALLLFFCEFSDRRSFSESIYKLALSFLFFRASINEFIDFHLLLISKSISNENITFWCGMQRTMQFFLRIQPLVEKAFTYYEVFYWIIFSQTKWSFLSEIRK